MFAPTNAAFDKLPKGTTGLKTVGGDTLWVAMKDGKLWLKDGKG